MAEDKLAYKSNDLLIVGGYGLTFKLVMTNPRLSKSAKLVFCYICSYAGTDFTNLKAFPTRERMQEEIPMDKDIIGKSLNELKEWDLIQVEKGRNRNNIYFINLNPISYTEKIGIPKKSDIYIPRKSVVDIPKKSVSITNTTTNKKTNTAYTDSFEKFWALYPKKKEKQVAYKTFLKLMKNKVDVNVILDCTKQYNLSVKGTEEKYIKNASTFLNEDRYLDYMPIKKEVVNPQPAQKTEIDDLLEKEYEGEDE